MIPARLSLNTGNLPFQDAFSILKNYLWAMTLAFSGCVLISCTWYESPTRCCYNILIASRIFITEIIFKLPFNTSELPHNDVRLLTNADNPSLDDIIMHLINIKLSPDGTGLPLIENIFYWNGVWLPLDNSESHVDDIILPMNAVWFFFLVILNLHEY